MSPAPSATPSGLKDPALQGELQALKGERQELMRTRERIVAEMKAKIDAAKKQLKTEDEKLLKAELEKDPEWQSLYRRCEDLNTALGERHQKALDALRARMVSKQGQGGAGAASPKKISK